MLIKIFTVSGREIELDVEKKDTIEKVKRRIEEKEGIPPRQQRLVFSGREMVDSKTIENYGVGAGQKINLVLSLRG